MSKRIDQLMAASQGKRFASEQEITDYLDAERITDTETRIAFKISMAAAGELGTDAAVTIGSLASDRAVYRPQTPPLGREVGTMLRKAGLSVDRRYSSAEITEALGRSPLELVEKMTVRAELLDRGLIMAAGAVTPTPQPAPRELSASTPHRVLRDPKTGKPATLRGYSW